MREIDIHIHTHLTRIFCGYTRKKKQMKDRQHFVATRKKNRTSIYKVNTNENHCSSSQLVMCNLEYTKKRKKGLKHKYKYTIQSRKEKERERERDKKIAREKFCLKTISSSDQNLSEIEFLFCKYFSAYIYHRNIMHAHVSNRSLFVFFCFVLF